MSTGYTCVIDDKPDATLREYLLRCVRAFGAAVGQRDDPLDAALVTEVRPDEYYADALVRAEAELVELRAVTDVGAAAARENARIRRKNKRRERVIAAYSRMRAQVESWNPPEAYGSVKALALEQLSIGWPSPAYPETEIDDPAEWYADRVRDAERSVERRRANLEEEVRRCAKKTRWLRGFVAALPALQEKEDEPCDE